MCIIGIDTELRSTGEAQVWGPETALHGATERVVPILMTASATTLGLLPPALGSGQAGREIEGPMAIVILGGLVTSTALNLPVLPTLAVRVDEWTAPVSTEHADRRYVFCSPRCRVRFEADPERYARSSGAPLRYPVP
jgi:YHS domain-containing protein